MHRARYTRGVMLAIAARCLVIIACSVVFALNAIGCAAPGAAVSDHVLIAPGQYAQAFDAALAIARDRGTVATIRDRRSGLIETEPVFAPTLCEPWHWNRGEFEQMVEGTVALQRRRVRFEFAPAEQPPETAEPAKAGAMAGPDFTGQRGGEADLTAWAGPIELRVIVALERAHQPGQRRSTWTRKATTATRVFPEDREEGAWPNQFWQVVARDLETENRMLAQIEAELRR